jgi:ABC-type dipeptide/oligopeptide/nickel transport system permease component
MTFPVRRAIRAALLLFGVSVLCFLFTEMAPGSFFDEMRLNPQISPETISLLRAHYGLDQPFLVRYRRWASAVAHGDLGFSIAYNAPVAPLLWSRALNTLLLAATALLLTWLIGVPLGVWSAASRGRWLDRVVESLNSLLISIPEIVIALGLLALAVRLRTVPVGGMMSLGFEELSTWGKMQDLVRHLLLPTTILVLAGLAFVIRHVRASVAEVLDAPYVRAARGLGIGRTWLLFRHVLPVAASPAIALFGFSIASLLSGSLLVEVATGWPGLGPLLLEATLARDFYLVIGGIIFSALFLIAGNFIADLLLLASDPRIRTGGADAD